MTTVWDHSRYLWPAGRAGEALETVARHCGFISVSLEVPLLPVDIDTSDRDELGRWVDWAGRRLGCEVEPTATPMSEITALLCDVGPALLHIPSRPEIAEGWLVILKGCGPRLKVIGPDLTVYAVRSAELAQWICEPLQAPYVEAIDHLLDVAQVPAQRRAATQQALLQEHLGTQQVGLCWQVRCAPNAPFRSQILQAKLPQKVGWMAVVFLVLYSAEILGWGLVGRITLNGRLDMGWLATWGLLVLTLIPLHLLGGWLDATFALDFGRILKTRLLAGILQSDLDLVRQQGAGQLLSRVMESQALESLALNGGMGVLVATLELGIAAVVLNQGAGGLWQMSLLAGWLVLSLVLSFRYFTRLRHWTLLRLDMTHGLIERMVGHRTRLAQERSGRRDAQEDIAMRDYLEASKAMDHSIVPAAAIMPRGWMLVGLLGLLPAFVAGGASAGALAIALGGMLMANRALQGISAGLAALSRARVAWLQVAGLFAAPLQTTHREPFISATSGRASATRAAPVIDASQITFGYSPQTAKVLNGVDLSIYPGERILLEGPSGAGKSTIASLLVGLRVPQSGLLLLNGLDRHTLGESWHQMTTEAPQFHENHILSGSLAFNLLMGRNWPASADELTEAQELCEELGLGDLLQRMPSGIMQMVGETGWQLSHGERSRIFLARALLQKAQLTVLDESFAALDPQTLKLCLECALRRTDALLVIAHP